MSETQGERVAVSTNFVRCYLFASVPHFVEGLHNQYVKHLALDQQ